MGTLSGRDELALNEDLTKLNMDDAIRGVWRIAVKALTDKMLVRIAPKLYSRSYNMGSATSEFTGERSALMVITGWPQISRFVLPSLSVAVVQLLEHAGRSDVHAEPTATEDGGRFEVHWR